MAKVKDFRAYRIKNDVLEGLAQVKTDIEWRGSLTLFIGWVLEKYVKQQSEQLQIQEESPAIAAGVERVIKDERKQRKVS